MERALSQFAHSRRLGLESLELEEALAVEAERLEGAEEVLAADDGCYRSHQEHSYLSRSRYEIQLERWLRLFPREQLFLRRSEDLFEQPEQLWSDLLDFLNVDSLLLPKRGRKAHVGSRALDNRAAVRLAEIRADVREQLADTYARLESHYGLCWFS